MLRPTGWLVALALTSTIASASPPHKPRVAAKTTDEPSLESTTARALGTIAEPARMRRHALYLEAFGKGGLWGIGYDYQLTSWLAAGGVASFNVLDGQRMYSLTPYLAVYPVTRGHHRWFVDAGPQIVHLATPSPVPEWNGTSSTGIGGETSTGYEFRDRFLFRAYGQLVGGRGGVFPWLGVSIGWTF